MSLRGFHCGPPCTPDGFGLPWWKLRCSLNCRQLGQFHPPCLGCNYPDHAPNQSAETSRLSFVATRPKLTTLVAVMMVPFSRVVGGAVDIGVDIGVDFLLRLFHAIHDVPCRRHCVRAQPMSKILKRNTCLRENIGSTEVSACQSPSSVPTIGSSSMRPLSRLNRCRLRRNLSSLPRSLTLPFE